MLSLLSRSRYYFSSFAGLLLLLQCLCLSVAAADEEKPSPKPARLLDRSPFDRITLDAANGSEVIDVQLLDLPNRSALDPLPNQGSLELRRLSEPSVLYTLQWSSIAQVQLFEELLLEESKKLANAQDLDQAFEYLGFLHNNYPRLNGLDEATEQYLREDTLTAYKEKDYEEAFTIVTALHDLNPQHQGLGRFVETITDKLIAQHLAERDFRAARSVLDTLSSSFSGLELGNIRTWREKFEIGAGRQLKIARQAIDRDEYPKARKALRRAVAILPSAAGAAEMLEEVNLKSPQIVVGVDQHALVGQDVIEWAPTRVGNLLEPKLLNLTGFGAEGGTYQCDWARLSIDETGLLLDLQLNANALRQGITAEAVALELLNQADPAHSRFRSDYADLLRDLQILSGNTVRTQWHRSHVRPEAMLLLKLKDISDRGKLPGIYERTPNADNEMAVTFSLQTDGQQAAGPKNIIEKVYENEEASYADLLNGEIDVLAKVPPWQVARLQQSDGVEVLPYRLPTIHVLVPNYDNPIMGRREFRRALCYGIDRRQILSEILLGGEQRRGFRVLSAPLPAGVTLTDPVGYAYNQGIQPREYEPRLAAVLAAVARNSLAKQQALRQRTANPGKQDSKDSEVNEPDEESPEPLVLAYAPTPVATTACQTIKLQLDAVGLSIKLMPVSPGVPISSIDHDLRYVELALWEPITDARRLLGPEGLAGSCSSSMSLALSDVDKAKNWKEARSRLQEVHEIAFNDLPVIPLWQTVDFYAHRDSLQGVGTSPVTLYQNVTQWRRVRIGGDR